VAGQHSFHSRNAFCHWFCIAVYFRGLTGIFLGNSAIDIELHDTYFVIAHFHIVMGVSAFFGMLAGVYHWFPKMYGKMMNNTLGYIHFWITLVGAYLIFWPMHYMGMAGVPRRYYSFDAFQSFNMFGSLNQFITLAAMLVFFAQLLFLVNFFYSIFMEESSPLRTRGIQTRSSGRHRSKQVMATGPVICRPFIAGPMITVRMVMSSYRKQRL
jgi:cytochrome c oxidase subunit 1